MKSIEELKQAAINELAMCQNTGDHEAAHSDADEILRRLLIDLGFAEVVAEFDKIDKWYA